MTRTIAKRCADDHTVDWRVSVATLNGSAKFSLFPGLDRTLLPLDEGAVDLHSQDGASIARLGQPVRFSGDLQIWASVSAQPVNVLNVMTRRGAMMEGKCRSCTAARGPVTAVVRSDRPTIVS
ncbi:environmental stress-induced protein Ves [Paraburkholderia sp. JPY162]|uniref:Environmental stress-induced protein Ves n=2 Tax=Paraburkholderia youngii TaxID=2782701 RepID=A0A7W8L2J0_9BURK|nr:environmental stress-induced protein Ves [Paraburkholderia youngii]